MDMISPPHLEVPAAGVLAEVGKAAPGTSVNLKIDGEDEFGKKKQFFVPIALPEGMGFPDGMTIDSEDKLWVALWAGWGVARFDPITGELLEKIDVPASQVTACAFGGAELKDLYITTARRDLQGAALDAEPHAGGLFHTRVDAAGVPSAAYAG